MALKIPGGIGRNSDLTIPENLRIPVNAVDLLMVMGSGHWFDPPLDSDPMRAAEMEKALHADAMARLVRVCREAIPIRCRSEKRMNDEADMQRHVRMIDMGGSGARISGGDYGSKKVVRQFLIEIDEDAVGIETPLPPEDREMLARLRAAVEARGRRPVSTALLELAMHTKMVEDHYAAHGEAAYRPVPVQLQPAYERIETTSNTRAASPAELTGPAMHLAPHQEAAVRYDAIGNQIRRGDTVRFLSRFHGSRFKVTSIGDYVRVQSVDGGEPMDVIESSQLEVLKQ